MRRLQRLAQAVPRRGLREEHLIGMEHHAVIRGVQHPARHRRPPAAWCGCMVIGSNTSSPSSLTCPARRAVLGRFVQPGHFDIRRAAHTEKIWLERAGSSAGRPSAGPSSRRRRWRAGRARPRQASMSARASAAVMAKLDDIQVAVALNVGLLGGVEHRLGGDRTIGRAEQDADGDGERENGRPPVLVSVCGVDRRGEWHGAAGGGRDRLVLRRRGRVSGRGGGVRISA